jgi:pimeloyl-ACP methyl ester carboxylesterase
MAPVTARPATEIVSMAGVELEVLRAGAGNPLLLLHGCQHLDPRLPIVELLAHDVELIAPSHPGFGRSSRPADFGTVYDLVHLYLGLLDTLPRGPLTLMGLSFGGWLAAEIAVKAGRRIDRLILVDALGIKVSDRGAEPYHESLHSAVGVVRHDFISSRLPSDCRHQRIFKLASPTNTRITVMIQNRTITLGSAQPLSSK